MWHPPYSYPASQALCTSYLPTEVQEKLHKMADSCYRYCPSGATDKGAVKKLVKEWVSVIPCVCLYWRARR